MFYSKTNPLHLSQSEQEQVALAIKNVEGITSGELRICIENGPTSDVEARSKEVFSMLSMYKTKYANGVLIYVNVATRKFSIIGDKGFDQKIPLFYWQSKAQELGMYFSQNRYAEGLIYIIEKMGEDLERLFPFEAGDINELPDEIHYL